MNTEFTITYTKEFKILINYLNNICVDVLFDITKDGIILELNNGVHINLCLYGNNLKNLKLGETRSMGITILLLWKLIKNISNTNEIIFNVSNECILYIVVTIQIFYE